MALTPIRVTGSYLNADGTPSATGGVVIFALSDELRDATDGVSYSPAPIAGSINPAGVLVGSDGNPGVLLVPNNDPRCVPGNTTYAVVERLVGTKNPPTREVTVPFDASAGTVALAALPSVDV